MNAIPDAATGHVRDWSLAELAPLDAGAAEQLAVLLLRHALATLLDDRTHSGTSPVDCSYGRMSLSCCSSSLCRRSASADLPAGRSGRWPVAHGRGRSGRTAGYDARAAADGRPQTDELPQTTVTRWNPEPCVSLRRPRTPVGTRSGATREPDHSGCRSAAGPRLPLGSGSRERRLSRSPGAVSKPVAQAALSSRVTARVRGTPRYA